MSLRVLSTIALSACLSCGAVGAQITPPWQPAPPEVLADFGMTSATVQKLTLPLRSQAPFEVRLTLAGASRALYLVPHDVRATDFQLLLDDGAAIRRLPTPPAVTFRGTVSGMAGAEVAASLIDGQLFATIHTQDSDAWAVEPLSTRNAAMPRESHIVYRARDLRARDAHCEVDALATDTAPVPAPGPAALRIAELAIDADVRFYTLSGSNANLVQNRIMAVINGCNLIYRRDCEIEYSVTTILVRTTNIYAWNGDLCNLLTQFRNYWNANHGSIRRDLAHLFTGEGTFSGVIGCASVGVVCTTSAYGASKAYSDLTTNVGLVSHEMGHNWNAPHCDAQATCNIMCSGLGGCSGNLSAFEPYSANIMIAHRNSRSCLSNPVAPTLTAIAPVTATSWAPAPVDLTGTNMTSVTSVTVAGQTVNFAPVTPTTIRFTPRAPFPIATHPVVVTNTVGSSNPLNLTITGNHPSVLELSPVLLRNFPVPLTMHSDVNWVGLPFLSLSNLPSTAPGLVSLGIGNGFSDLIQLSFLVGSGSGTGMLPLVLPLAVPVGLVVYTQIVAFNPANVMLPLEVSNVVRSQVL